MSASISVSSPRQIVVSEFELGDHVVALEVAELIAQHGLAQLALRGGRPVPGIGGRAIGGERVLLAAEALGEPAHQHGKRRLHGVRDADGLEIVEVVGGGVEIADLDGRAHVVLERDALQLDRQGRHRRRHGLERVARLGPAALLRISERPPQRRVVLVADAGLGEILERVVGPVHHHFGDGAQHQRGSAFGPICARRRAPRRARPWLPDTCRARCKSAPVRAAAPGADAAAPPRRASMRCSWRAK